MNEFGLSENALKIFKNTPKYCIENETIENCFKRVAKEYATNNEEFELAYSLLKEHKWRPNTPVFFNAGTKHKIYAACYVCDISDSMESIYDIANVARKVFQFGSGLGIPIGNLREKDAFIFEGEGPKEGFIDATPESKSSGSITFMKLFDAVAETTRSGGRVRRAALLCAMPVSHPDILDFIKCKKTDGSLSNMNISVSITDEFMERLNTNTPFELKSVYDDKRIDEIDPNIIWDNIVDMSWKTADPGILFLDNINKYNVLKKTLKIKSTNPCGELPLIPWGACNLSAINLSKFVMGNWIEDKATFDWDELYSTAYNIMGLMDNIIDNSEFPDERFKDISTKYRNVGIGFMGLADVMYMLNIKYDSGEGRRFAKEIMKTIQTACVEKSAELAEQKGTFHNYSFHKDDVEEIVSKLIENNEEVMEKVRSYGLRNIAHSCIAPTGTVAISADCSYGMEPTFGLVFKKNLIDGGTMHFVNSIFEKKFENEEWYNEKLLDKISKNGGSLKGIHGIPEKVRRVFVVAHDIKSKDRIDMQAALSKHVSSAISSTVNLPKETTKEEISNLYKYAYESGLKGITIYRDGCKRNQPITFKEEKRDENFDRPMTLIGETHRINTANGHLYITVNRMPNGEIIEIMPQLGKGGNKMNSMTEAVGRLLSTGLQKPLTIKEIVKQLKGINDESTWCKLDENDTKPVQILSIPDAIAKLLEKKYLTNGSDSGTFGIESDEICPKCGSNLLLMEGCLNCTCGYSKCS